MFVVKYMRTYRYIYICVCGYIYILKSYVKYKNSEGAEK